jgi:hypothetical protein
VTLEDLSVTAPDGAGLRGLARPANSNRDAAVLLSDIMLWGVPNAGHCGASSAAPAEFNARVIAWFTTHGSTQSIHDLKPTEVLNPTATPWKAAIGDFYRPHAIDSREKLGLALLTRWPCLLEQTANPQPARVKLGASSTHPVAVMAWAAAAATIGNPYRGMEGEME